MIDAEERALMQQTVRSALADAVATGGEAIDIDAVLAQLGWLELLRDEPGDAIRIVFGALGATNATSTALDDVMTSALDYAMASALGRDARADLAVVLPPFAGWRAPGRIAGGTLNANGLATARAGNARELLVVCEDSEIQAVVVPAAAAEIRRVRGIDPDGGLHAIQVQTGVAGLERLSLDRAAWPAVVAVGQRAVAHQIEGACRTMLDLACSHALSREQFGRPIARFQAVRHRLADALVAVEALAAALEAARDEPGSETAALAKGVAGRTAKTVARHSQQVLAGIGFTAEHPFHRFLKRTLALEGLFGSEDEIVLDVGRRLLATRQVPTLIEL